MQSSSLLRSFGWHTTKGKWIAPGHSRPLTLEQAKAAFARDLRAKSFEELKKSGKLDRAQAAINSGYSYEKGKFKSPKGRKRLSLEQVSERQLKEELSLKNKSARSLGFRTDKDRKKISDWTKDNLETYRRFVIHYDDTHGQSTVEQRAEIARMLYAYKHNSGIREQRALNDLLIYTGYRTGNEPYPAGETPKIK